MLCSVIAGATMVSANLNLSQNGTNNESLITNDVNQTENETNQTENQTTNQTIDNQTRDELISNLSQKVSELNVLCNGSDEATIADYSDQKLQELKSKVNSSQISTTTKKKILLNINLAINTNNAAIGSINAGNEQQANSELQYEYQILEIINTQIINANGTAMNSTTADNLTQAVNLIKAGHENGATWILENNLEMELTQTSPYYSNVQNKISEIKSIVSELKAAGVPVEIKVMDASELQSQGQLNSVGNETQNKTKVKAAIPVIVIIVGVVLVLTAEAGAAYLTAGEIEAIEKKDNVDICLDCENKMYAINMAAAGGGMAITLGVAIFAGLSLTFMALGLEILEYTDFVTMVPEGIIGSLFTYLDQRLGDGCNIDTCPFYKKKKFDLSVDMNPPSGGQMNKNCPINVTVSNNKYGDASSFKVTFYENSTPISTQIVSGLAGKNKTTVSFDWTPTRIGEHSLSVTVDPDNQINETDENNNVDSETVSVTYPITKLELYDMKVLPSSSDPNVPYSITYYFKADHPVLLNPSMGTPTFIYKTTPPEYSGVGFQVFYPYGGIWQYYSNSQDVNGTWNSCFSEPYASCAPGVTMYPVDHWASGAGYYQYFAVRMCTTPGPDWGPWRECQIKTQLTELYVVEKA